MPLRDTGTNAFQAQYRALQNTVEAALERYLPPETAWPSTIHQAMRYSVLGGGKRLRPVLVLATCQAVGGSLDEALPAACAVEFLHCYSLVHDDLPCMDDDTVRRGQPTTHIVFGDAMAVLVGDALLTLAFDCLADPNWPVTDRIARLAGHELAAAAGTFGLIAGQVADLEAEGKSLQREQLERIHAHKTGALFKACVRIGAIVGKATAEQVEQLTAFADKVGLAFQIVDDLLDVVGEEAAIGRPAGSDQRRGKVTFVDFGGVEAARTEAAATIKTALQHISSFGPEADFLRLLGRFVVDRRG